MTEAHSWVSLRLELRNGALIWFWSLCPALKLVDRVVTSSGLYGVWTGLAGKISWLGSAPAAAVQCHLPLLAAPPPPEMGDAYQGQPWRPELALWPTSFPAPSRADVSLGVGIGLGHLAEICKGFRTALPY